MTPQNTKASAKIVRPSLRLTPEEHAILKAEAERQHRSIEGQLRWMVQALRTEEKAA